jgi:ribosomal protein L12E/L44/L45/RPP1/RPP2
VQQPAASVPAAPKLTLPTLFQPPKEKEDDNDDSDDEDEEDEDEEDEEDYDADDLVTRRRRR